VALDSKVVSDWIALQHLGHSHEKADALWYAWEAVYQATTDDPDSLWTFILDALRSDSSGHLMSNLAAGPLEDLLSAHGPAYIERIEAEARSNPLFASLLGGVWQSDIRDDIWARVQAVWDRRGWDGLPAT
jgi:hypothetical protein